MTHRLLFTLIVFLTTANVLVWGFLWFERAYAEEVYPGVWVDAQPLAGLTKDQVVDRLEPIHKAMLEEKVILHLKDKQYEPTLGQLGYEVDTKRMANEAMMIGRGKTVKETFQSFFSYYKDRQLPLRYEVNQGVFDSYLNEIGKETTRQPKDLAIVFQDNQLVIQPAEDGLVLNKEELRNAIQTQVRPGKTAEITLTYGTQKPTITDPKQAEAAIETLRKLLARPLTLTAENTTVKLEPATIYSLVYYQVKDNALTVNFDEDKIRAEITKMAKKVDIKPLVKRIQTPGDLVLDEGRDGRELDAADTQAQILDRLTTANFATPIALNVKTVTRKTVTVTPDYQLGRYEGKYIEVDLSSQRMHLIEGQNYQQSFVVSTGKWSSPTPIGEFTIKNHIQTAWSNRYKLYMPFWMAIQTPEGSYDGYGIHGLPYWPNGAKEGENHLGTPVSHGCIRLGAGAAEFVYNWAENGTRVIIHQ